MTAYETSPTDSDRETHCNFRRAGLSNAARGRLGAIAESQVQHPHRGTKLLSHILQHGYDPDRGLYLPLSDRPELTGYYTENIENLPAAVSPIDGWSLILFTNALLVPRPDSQRPSSRPTNAGFLIVTHEFDCKTKEEFEETLAWSASSGPFSQLDNELKKYRDYRGYCIVLAGNRSLHFHFLFDTTHLKYAPSDADREKRIADQQIYAAIMPKVYHIYWDHIDNLIRKILKPSVETDRKLRSIYQWRRTPWAVRKLDKLSEILGLPAGATVPQLVIKEEIRTKAAKGSSEWAVIPEFSAATPPSRGRSAALTSSSESIDANAMFAMADDLFRIEWGDYPKLESVCPEGGNWLFKFYNHRADTSADTYCRGDYRTLDLCGNHSLSGQFFLPDGLTANQLGDHLALLCGHPALEPMGITDAAVQEPSTPPAECSPLAPASKLQILKAAWVAPFGYTYFERHRETATLSQ